MNVCGKNLALRAIEVADLPTILRWSNDPDIQSQLGGWHFPLSLAMLQVWIASFRHDALDQRFAIDVSGVGCVGLVTLTSINWKDRNAFHGLLIGDREHQRKGYAANALMAIMRYAFLELGLERLESTIVEYNAPSLALHIQKCGWAEEGRKRRSVFRQGRYWDSVMIAITKPEYEERLARGTC